MSEWLQLYESRALHLLASQRPLDPGRAFILDGVPDHDLLVFAHHCKGQVYRERFRPELDAVLLGVLLIPLLLGMIAASLSLWAGYLLWLVIGSVTLPVVSASLFCSYRDIFSARDNWIPADRRRQARVARPDEESLRPL